MGGESPATPSPRLTASDVLGVPGMLGLATRTTQSQTEMLHALSLELARHAATPVERTKRVGSLFADDAPLVMSITADFTTLAAEKQQATRLFAAQFQVEHGGRTYVIPGTVRARGQSSLSDLPFPKLQLGFAVTRNTPFEGHPSLCLGVKGGDGGNSHDGRLLEDAAPLREAAGYGVLSALGIAAPAARAVDIRYIDSKTGKVRHESAFLLESSRHVGERSAGQVISDLQEADPKRVFDVGADEILRHELGMALLGNDDWDFARASHRDPQSYVYFSGQDTRLHNTELLAHGQHGQPVARDLDLSNWVLQGSSPSWVSPPLDEHVAVIRRGNHEGSFQRVAASLLSRRAWVAERLAALPLDPAGRRFLEARLETFWTALEAERQRPRPLYELARAQ